MPIPPIPPDQILPEKDEIRRARNEGRITAMDAEGKPLAIVAISQAYFRMVASLALRSPDPDDALDQLLSVHNQSARIELRCLREAGL